MSPPKIKTKQKEDEKRYKELVQQIVPKPPIVKNVFWAFVVGGLISMLGQLILNMYMDFNLGKDEAGAATIATMIFLSALLTGIGVYDSIGKVAGAGSIVPITGFANAMVSSALEFKREGMIFGVAAKIFSLAGPVLVYGFVVSWIVGLTVFLVK